MALCIGAVFFGAARLRSRYLPAWRGTPARLAEIVIATSALLLVLELLGTAQILDPAPIVIGSLAAGLGMAYAGAPIRPDGSDEDDAPPQMGGWATSLSLGVITLVAAHWAALSLHSYSVGMYEGDANWYHLPYAARFMQEGSITSLHYASPSYLSWFHPLNSEMFHAMGMVLTGRDIASPFWNLLWLAVALLSAWCIGRPFGVAPITATAAALALDLPVFANTQAGENMSDLFGVTFILAAAALLVHAYRQEPEQRGPLDSPAVVAGLALGLSIGAKLSYAGPVIALIAVLVVLARRGTRTHTALTIGLPAILTGAYWYGRDFWYVHNPFPYVQKIGPIDLPGPNEGLNGGPPYSVAHYLFDGKVWDDFFLPGLHDEVGPIWFVLVAAALIGMAVALIRARRSNPVVAALGAAAVVAFVFYLVTPEAAEGPEGVPISFTAGLRVLEPALVLGLVLAGLATAGLDLRLRWAALAALSIVTVVATGRAADFWDSDVQLAGAILMAAGLVLLPVWAAWSWTRGGKWRLRTAAVVVAAFVLSVGLGWLRTERYFDHRYRTDDVPPLYTQQNLVPLYRWATGIHDSRIATSGIMQYGLYGDDLSNHVQYIGVVGHDRSFREVRTCATWRRLLNEGNYDYVVAMPRFGGHRELQARWTRGPWAQRIWHSAPITVFRLTGTLDPSGCATLPSL